MQGTKKRKLCPHCDLPLGRTAYYARKKKYYSTTSGVWQKQMTVKPSEVDCEYQTDQDEVSASDLEYTAEYNDAVRNFFLYLFFTFKLLCM